MESQPQHSYSGLIPKTFTRESKGAKVILIWKFYTSDPLKYIMDTSIFIVFKCIGKPIRMPHLIEIPVNRNS